MGECEGEGGEYNFEEGPPTFGAPFWHFFALVRSVGSPGAFFSSILGPLGSFCAFLSWASLFYRFFSFLEAPGGPLESKKPLKSLYCRQFSRFHSNGKGKVPGALWAAFGTTFGLILGAFGVPGALLGATWGPKGRQKSKKVRKTEVSNVPGRPEGPKGRPRRPRTSKMEPRGTKIGAKITKNDVSKSKA